MTDIDIAHRAYTIRAVVRSIADAVEEIGPPGPVERDAHDHLAGLVAAAEHLVGDLVATIEAADRLAEAEAREIAADAAEGGG